MMQVLHMAAGGKGLDVSVFPSYKAAWMPRIMPHGGPALLLCEGQGKPSPLALEGGRALWLSVEREGLPVAQDCR